MPHIHNHEVSEDEVIDILDGPDEDRRGSEGTRVAVGQTRARRFLRVIYRQDKLAESLFVITAYEIRGSEENIYECEQIAGGLGRDAS